MPYTALPGQRFAYERDGTIVNYAYTTNVPANLAAVDVAKLNDEDTDTYDSAAHNVSTYDTIGWLFPEARDLTGIFVFMQGNTGGSTILTSSVDTTDGLNGTWTSVGTVTGGNVALNPNFRSAIVALTPVLGIKGLRARFNSVANNGDNHRFVAIHLYGTRVNPPGLQFWDPTLNQAASPSFLDFGDMLQGATSTKTFRVRNNNALTANTITVSATAVSQTMAVEFSIGGGAYASSLGIGTLAPAGLSGLITARRIVPANEPLVSQAMQIAAEAASFS